MVERQSVSFLLLLVLALHGAAATGLVNVVWENRDMIADIFSAEREITSCDHSYYEDGLLIATDNNSTDSLRITSTVINWSLPPVTVTISYFISGPRQETGRMKQAVREGFWRVQFRPPCTQGLG